MIMLVYKLLVLGISSIMLATLFIIEGMEEV